MPTQETIKKAKHDLAEGKQPSTAAGEFVREEMDHIRQGKHGARSTKQAIAIGLSKARKAGIPLPVPAPGKVPQSTRRAAARELARGRQHHPPAPSPRRSRATEEALQHEGHQAASHTALSAHAKRAAAARSPRARSASAKEAAATKGPLGRSRAAKKAAATRKRHGG